MVGTESGPRVEEGVQPGMFSQIPPTPKGVDADHDEAEAVLAHWDIEGANGGEGGLCA